MKLLQRKQQARKTLKFMFSFYAIWYAGDAPIEGLFAVNFASSLVLNNMTYLQSCDYKKSDLLALDTQGLLEASCGFECEQKHLLQDFGPGEIQSYPSNIRRSIINQMMMAQMNQQTESQKLIFRHLPCVCRSFKELMLGYKNQMPPYHRRLYRLMSIGTSKIVKIFNESLGFNGVHFLIRRWSNRSQDRLSSKSLRASLFTCLSNILGSNMASKIWLVPDTRDPT